MKALFSFIFLFSVLFSIGQTNVVGTIKDSLNKPLSNWVIENETTKQKVVSDANGKFTIPASLNDVLNFSSGDKTANKFIIENTDLAGFTAKLTIVGPKDAGSAISSNSYWVGATLGYNLAGKSNEDIIGSAKVVINPMESKLFKGEGGIVGNFSNFQAKDDSTNQQDIKKVTQSTQGLFLGLSDIWTLTKKNSEVAFRIQFITGARLNAFSDVGPDSSHVSLLQFRNSLGFEIEGFKFKNGGALNFSTEFSISFFDKSKYAKIFNENKSYLFVMESSVILPISKNVGILFNSTISPKKHPVFMAGVIFKGDK